GGPAPTAVVYPCSLPALAGALEAAAAGLLAPVLVGPRARIEKIADEGKLDLSGCLLHDAADAQASARDSAAMAGAGKVALLMKGSLHTDELMSVMIARDAGLRTERRISHVFVMDIPSHERLLLLSDAAVNIAPSLETKRHITQNAIEVAQALGIELPRVAVL